jgi:hypothetical protein
VLHGSRTYLLQSDDGQIKETHSISAGLDYPGVGPQHAMLKATGRVRQMISIAGRHTDSRQPGSRARPAAPPRARQACGTCFAAACVCVHCVGCLGGGWLSSPISYLHGAYVIGCCC